MVGVAAVEQHANLLCRFVLDVTLTHAPQHRRVLLNPRLGASPQGAVEGGIVDESPRRCSRILAARELHPKRAPQGIGSGVADAVVQLDGAAKRQFVVGVPQELDVAQHILDVGLLEKTHARTHQIRDATTTQLDLQLECISMSTIQYSYFSKRNTLVTKL